MADLSSVTGEKSTRIANGVRFGNLTILGKDELRGKWVCKCDCGNFTSMWDRYLKDGSTTDCGCKHFSANDLTGKKFGRWEVVGPEKPLRIQRWLCHCECGTTKVVEAHTLKNGVSKSCGCLQRETTAELGKKTAIDLTGKVFGRLTVIHRAGTKIRKATWFCECECGNHTTVYSASLLKGTTRSCGCFHKEMAARRMYKPWLTNEDRMRRRGGNEPAELREWKLAVYKKNDYVCQSCGYHKGGILVAHHKNSWDAFPLVRFDVKNGVTCCKKCHVEFHNVYGYGNNTENQWEEFIKEKLNGKTIERRVLSIRKKVDLMGTAFGRLVVEKKSERVDKPYWICKCECGKSKEVLQYLLVRGTTKSCGCLQTEASSRNGKKNRIPMIGNQYGFLTVIDVAGKNKVMCKCACGEKIVAYRRFLINGTQTNCGCKRKEKLNLVGQRFDKLIVRELVGKDKNRNNIWNCLCDCGNIINKNTAYLKKNHARSCGCHQKRSTP